MPSLIRSSRGYGKNNSSQVTDVNAKYTSLLLTGDQTSKSYIADNSLINADPAIYGDTKPSNLNPYAEGFYSNYFDGTTDKLSVDSNPIYQFGLGDFTIEAWVYMTDINSAGTIFDNRTGTSSTHPVFYFNSNASMAYYVAGTNFILGSAFTFQNRWVHVALCRASNITRMFYNGTQVGDSYTDNNNFTTSGTVCFGGGFGNANMLIGYLSNLRVLKGVALYTQTFTPPFQPLTRTTETVLLTCQSSSFIDRSIYSGPLGGSLTVAGDVRVRPFNPFEKNLRVPRYVDAGGNSVYFDGSGDGLTLPYSTDLSVWEGGFTIECWIYVLGYGSGFSFIGQMDPTGVSTDWVFGLTSGGVLQFYQFNGTGQTFSSSATIPLNTWNHVAMCCLNGSVYLYHNGRLVLGPTAISGTPTHNQYTSLISIGRANNNSPFGYISNLRVVKNQALYYGSFTPLTTPLGLIQPARANVATLYNYTSIPANGRSVFFDGTGDYLTVQSSSAFAFGTGNFTIEMWVYPTVSPATSWTPLMTIGFSGGGQEIRISQNINNTGYGYIVPNNAGNADTTAGFGTLTLNAWHHLALVRNGSTVTFYRNGLAVGSTTSVSFNFTNTTLIRIAGSQAAYTDGEFGGYINNLRVVKGTALYTSSFLVDRVPLTAVANTVLLTCQSSTIVDNSSNVQTITVNGNTVVNDNNPFSNTTVLLTCQSSTIVDNSANARVITAVGNAVATEYYLDTPVYKSLTDDEGSISLDGSGDYITIPYDNRYNIPASTPFTFECWVYTTSTAFFPLINRNWAYGSSGPTYSFSLNNGTTPSWGIAGTGVSTYVMMNDGIAGKIGQWNHYVFSRDASNVCRMFTNGVESTTTRTDSQALTSTSGAIFLGVSSNLSSPYANGQISNMRFIVGSCIYTKSFRPPTEPLQAIPNTVLLMAQTRIPNNNKSFLDDSSSMNTVTPIGNSTKTSFSPFGSNWSYYFDGVDDYLTVPNTFSLPTATTPFTMEAWVYFTAFTGVAIASTNYASSGAIPFVMGMGGVNGNTTPTGTPQFHYYNGSAWVTAVTASSSLNVNTWYHLAYVYTGSSATIYANGVNIGSAAISSWTTSSQANFHIGRRWDLTGGNYFSGYISNFNLTIGTALYTNNFTPSTKPSLPTETRSLAYSGYFDGTGDTLVRSSGPKATLASGPFTIEAWVNPTATADGAAHIIATNKYWNFGQNGGWIFFINSSGYLQLDASNGTYNTFPNVGNSGVVVPANRWTHVAVLRDGGNFIRFFMNGQPVGTPISYSASLNLNSAGDSNDTTIGVNISDGGYYDPYSGWIKDFRIVRGIALYSGAFLPPTQSLDLVQTARTNVAPLYNVTTTPTTGNSIYFDGSGDYLTIGNSSELTIGTSDATVEFWMYPTAVDGYRRIVASTTSTLTSGTFIIRFNSGSFLAGDGTNAITAQYVPPVNTWTHVAWVGIGGSTQTLYFNGIKVGSGISYNCTETIQYIGGYYSVGPAEYFAGYITNLRIVKGTAVYTANTTPNLTPLTAIANTSLLIGQSATIVDNSANTKSITVSGDTTVNTSINPFANSTVLLILNTANVFTDRSNNNILFTVNGDTSLSTFNPFSSSLPSIATAVSNKFEDLSPNRYPLTLTGNAKITKTTPFENYRLTPTTYSVYFDGTTDVLNIQGNFQYLRNSGANNQGDFCVEGWFYPRKDTGYLWTIGNETFGRFNCFVTSNKLNLNLFGDATTPLGVVPSNTWSHVAIVRANAVVSAYINGALSNAKIISANIGNSGNTRGTSPLWIGSDSSGASNFEGYISNFRVIRGTPYYTANTTLPTVPFEAIRGTELLTCQSATIVDNSPSEYFISANGDVKVRDFNPFGYITSPAPVKYDSNLFGGSVYFDGVGDYLTVTNSNALILANVFTMQGWFYKSTAFNGNSAIVSKGTATTGWQVMIHNSNTLMFSNATANINSVTPVRPYEWNHFAIVRGGRVNRTLLFLNGNLEATANIINPFAETNDMYIGSGRVAGANVFTGYISDLRIDNDVALYANSFVPSYNSVSTTKNAAFILDKRTAIIDYSLKNSVETVGNVKIKQFSPFNTDGSYSYYLDGTSGYLTVPPNNVANISGAFTLELWYYPITASSNKMLFGTWNNNQAGWGLWATPPGTAWNSQYIYFYYGNYGSNEASIGATNGAAQLGKWSHIAVTRDNNNNFWFFLDGQRLSTTTFGSGLGWSNTFNFVNTATNFIGIGGTSNYATTHGYISNLRFVANSSIYTGNFTPPTAPLPIVQSASANVLAIAPQFDQGYSVYFDGSGDYLTIPASPAPLSTTNSFTVEAWVYPTSASAGTIFFIMGLISSAGYAGIRVGLISSGVFVLHSTDGSTWAVNSGTVGSVPLNTWTHIAVTRNVNSGTLWINGISIYTFTFSTLYAGSTNYIGAISDLSNPSQFMSGYISNFRIVNGTAVYTGNFSVPTSPLGLAQDASANVSSLINTIPTNGGSVYFDGTGDYISVGGGNMVFAGDFTIECWVYPVRSSYVNYIGIMGGAAGNFVPIYVMSNGTLEGGIWGVSGLVYSSLTINLNQWNHIALVRSGSSLRFYINGVQDTSYTNSSTLTIANPTIAYTDNGTWLGYISNMRIVNGTAVYTANFTLPTTPLISIANTTLLACQSSTIIDNSANNRSLTIAGDTKVALTDSPFGFSNVRVLTAQSPIIIDNSLNNNSITVTGDTKVAIDGPFGSSNVRLLTARSRNYTDVSVANVRILPVGNVKIVPATPALTSNTITGNVLTIGQSYYFSGTGQDYITLPGGSDTFAFGTGDFTVEFWMYNQSATTGEYEIIESGTNNAFCIYKRASSSGFSFRGYANTDVLIATDATMANVANSWVHIAVSRSNIYTKAYVNGIVTANVTDRVNYVVPNTIITIGARTGGANYFTGYLSDLRVTKGVARYTSNTFTPPNKLPVSTTSYKVGTPLVIDAIIVAGGGAGGYGSTFADPAISGGGGGGAGGVITTNINVIANQIYSIVIGSGGTAPTSNIGSSGSNTTAFGYVAVGGGGGYSGDRFPDRSGLSGGSGGGAGFGSNVNSANGIIGQGFPGSASNAPFRTTGGSGAGGIAQAWNNSLASVPSSGYGYQKGGTGIKWVDGNYYGGGGGGYIPSSYVPVNNPSSNTALGGGGAGAVGTINATAGDTNTGGGGGGGGGSTVPSNAGSGGSGVVVIRYPMAYPAITNTTANVTITETGDFRYYKFTSSGNVIFPFTTTTLPLSSSPTSSIVMEYLVIAGGGGGGGTAPGGVSGAGGGAGGLINSSATLSLGTTYTITVGSGGIGSDGTTTRGSNGNPSVFDTFATAIGGGGGGIYTAPLTLLNGLSGGSGGGAANTPSAAGAGFGFPSPTQQGYPGGLGAPVASGGGGGAGSAGGTGQGPGAGLDGLGGNGGAGVFLTISGSSVGYAGGGGAGSDTAFNPGIGNRLGFGGGGGTPTGGGNGGNATIPATSGNVNTGGGGGGQSQWAPPLPTPSARAGAAGGSGIVILRHPTAYSVSASSTANVRTVGESVIYTFTQSGDITINSATLTPVLLR